MALPILGGALQGVGQFVEAITACQDAAAIFRESGDRHREGVALSPLGLALVGVRRFEEAIAAQEDDCRDFRETGDRDSEAQRGPISASR